MIWVLTRRAGIVARISPGWPILEDFITVLTPDGELVASLSLLKAFERSPATPPPTCSPRPAAPTSGCPTATR
ncbi:MAG TPA: hypothetical protein VGD06_03630 [Acidobacteriota bacterium]